MPVRRPARPVAGSQAPKNYALLTSAGLAARVVTCALHCLRVAAPLEQFCRARVSLAAHRTASLENTDVALACFTLYRSASRIRGPERSSGSALEIGWRNPQNGRR